MIRSHCASEDDPYLDLYGCPTLFEAFQVLYECGEPLGVALRSDRYCLRRHSPNPRVVGMAWSEPSGYQEVEWLSPSIDDGLPPDSAWPEDEDLELTDDILRELYALMFSRDYGNGNGLDGDDLDNVRADPADELNQTNLQVVCIVD